MISKEKKYRVLISQMLFEVTLPRRVNYIAEITSMTRGFNVSPKFGQINLKI